MSTNSRIGKIHSVYCRNFVTYDEGLLKPTEYLNIVIGPNGTGKSTLVAAIVIGLGGEPKLLSRSSAIQDYVKNGKDVAKVIVKLYSNERGDIATFQRDFNREGKSEFKVNDKFMTKDKFLKAVAAYNVQINNLCQFLPQDKVQDFAKMNAQEIFTNTLKSVCEQPVLDNFQKLKELQAEQSNGQDNIGKEMQKLKDLTTHVESLRQVVERFQARQEISDKIHICTAKKLWISVRDNREKFLDAKKRLTAAEKELRAQEKSCKKLEKAAQTAKNASVALKRASEEKKANLNVTHSQLQKVMKNHDETVSKIQSLREDHKRQVREFQNSKKEVEKSKNLLELNLEDLRNAQETLGASPSDIKRQQQNYNQELDEFRNQIKRLVTERSNINSKLDEEFIGEIRFIQNKIERSRNVEQQKIEILKAKFEDAYKAMCWVEENREALEGTVYRPILLEINVTDANHVIQIENSIQTKDLTSFACESKDDVNVLVEELVQKRGLRISVVHVNPADSVTYAPRVPLNNIKKYGFTNYVIDLISGPAPILNFLCSIYNLHNIPIGGAQVSRCVDEIPTTINQYFSGDVRFVSNVSHYSGQRTLVQNFLQKKNILGSVDEEELNLLQAKLQKLLKSSDALKNERTAIEAKIKEIEYKREEIRKKKLEFDAKLTNIENLKKSIERQTANLRRLKDDLIDLPKLKEELNENIQNCVANMINLLDQRVKLLKRYQEELVGRELATEEQTFHSQTIERTISEYNEENSKVDAIKRDIMDIKRSVDRTAEKCKKILDEAKSLTDNKTPDHPDFPYKQQFEELPDNVEELNECLNEYNARYNCMSDTDQGIVTEYEQKCNEVEIIKQNIEEKQRSNGNLESQINEIYEDWKHEIDAVVSELNNRFSGFMQSMHFAGEIALSHKNEHDFDSYGINISVQYRKETPLQTLDRCVQSGGERAVAIAVYTLSLQHLSHVPFRCVDEINQGMDPKNERKIFEMLVDETTKTGSSQYFFVTPKLLPNLKTHERMTIHIVFNGKLLERNINFG